MKHAIILGAALVLVGCGYAPYPNYEPDQSKRPQLFKECMASLPKGPEVAHYNDWDEVVEACERTSYYQSQVCVANCPQLPKVQHARNEDQPGYRASAEQ